MTTISTRPGQTEQKAPGRGFWPMRDLPVVGWLLATLLVALAHPLVPAPRWLLIHLLLLGAITHAILVWSRYFADALLHTAPGPRDRALQNLRLVLLDVGVVLVLVGVVSGHWPATVTGAGAVALAVAWHGWAMFRQLRAALPARFRTTIHYYLAAACLLPLGAGLGATLARVQGDPWHERLMVAHAGINLLGWIGLTVLGTLLTLWPTMLRTRLAERAEAASARALPVLLAGVLVLAAGALAGVRPMTTIGLGCYLAGVAMLARPFWAALRSRPPTGFATCSTLAAIGWLVGCLALLVVAFATAGSWEQLHTRLSWFTPLLATGFGAQVLLGALSYLVPVALGGGGGAVAAANAVLDRAFTVRVVATNAGLLACALPVPPAVRVLCSVVVLLALAAFLPLLVLAIRASRKVRAGRAEPPPRGVVGRFSTRAAVAALAVVLLAATGGVVVDRGGLDLLRDSAPVAAGITPTGHTTVVAVTAANMRFTPDVIEVPAGDRLVIDLTNTDREDAHDLVLDDGTDSGRLAPGERASVDVGVVGRDVDGWCAVVGHRQMGMTLAIEVTGAGSDAGGATPGSSGRAGMAGRTGMAGMAGLSSASPGAHDATIDPQAEPAPGFVARDAVLPPVGPGRVHRRTIHVREAVREVAPGVTQRLWTFDGTVPGPTLHGRVGDRFVITLVNDATTGHSIDFHAGSRAPDRVMRTIPPGGRLVYRFTADHAGIWMYHCSTMPMSAHIANGMFGAAVIDPPGLAPVDRSYVLVQSELYLGPQGGEVDTAKVAAEQPDAVVFNGYADQYDHRPLAAKVGERVRVWVLDAGPSRSLSFHVVGGQFDTTYSEGRWLLRRPGAGGAQVLPLLAAQGGFVELTFPEQGHYPFVNHQMVDAERGAHGTFAVTR